MPRLLYLYLILHVQYSFFEASPLIGEDIRIAYLEEFPFIVSIGKKICGDEEDNVIIQSQFCGGSLITAKHVLTAAHCLKNKQLQNIIVKIGSIDVLNSHAYKIKWWLTYTQWSKRYLPQGYDEAFINDIAIIKIRGSASHIALPTISYTSEADLYNKPAVTAGWGVIEGNKKPRYMRITNFIIQSPNNCEPFILQRDPFLKDLLPRICLCTASARGTSTTCGDSGSPLLYGENNIVGVNLGSCKPSIRNAPLIASRNMHASVNAYREFIEAVKRR